MHVEVGGEDTSPEKKPAMKITRKFGMFHNFKKVGKVVSITQG